MGTLQVPGTKSVGVWDYRRLWGPGSRRDSLQMRQGGQREEEQHWVAKSMTVLYLRCWPRGQEFPLPLLP